ncbi:ATP-binding cassette domain-containing protein [Clostridium bovifaecis]|uniref:ATP-binding cassette domain-containing protein n=1 Tax=Clostridium bovifaecis TaxID=2184719 RepID=A0A6I6EPT6_9CLOT|nr:ATP-binding cassette domain-containing protein [Clostridium bovifaecis]
MSVLEVEQLYRNFSSGKKAFYPLNFQVKKREIIGILGTSGCGKSTLLRVLAGLDVEYNGVIKVDGQAHRGTHEKIGFVFQEPRLMPWLRVEENVAFGLEGKYKLTKANEFLKLVGLESYSKHYPSELSGGMAQRVAIARALVTSPEILLLDEPFSALDAFTKMNLQDLLLDVWEKCNSTMIIVTHDIDEALYLCNRLFILRGHPGELVEELKIEGKRPRQRGDLNLASLKSKIIKELHL